MLTLSGRRQILPDLPHTLGFDHTNDHYADALHLNCVGVRQVAGWPLAGTGSALCSLHCGLVVFDSANVTEPWTQQLEVTLNADEAMIHMVVVFFRFVQIPCASLSMQLALKDFDFMIARSEHTVLHNLFSIASDRTVSSSCLQSFVAGSSDARCLLIKRSFLCSAVYFRIDNALDSFTMWSMSFPDFSDHGFHQSWREQTDILIMCWYLFVTTAAGLLEAQTAMDLEQLPMGISLEKGYRSGRKCGLC